MDVTNVHYEALCRTRHESQVFRALFVEDAWLQDTHSLFENEESTSGEGEMCTSLLMALLRVGVGAHN